MTFQETMLAKGIRTNHNCQNCRYVAGAHGAISGLCPKDGSYDGTFFEPSCGCTDAGYCPVHRDRSTVFSTVNQPQKISR